jgi:outer membrane protein assembly factor BamB
MPNTDRVVPSRRLRLWPGIAAGVLMAAGMLIIVVTRLLPIFSPDTWVLGMAGVMMGALVAFLWWILLSRAAWLDRLGVIVAMVVAIVVMRPLLDKSIVGGAMGGLGYILSFAVSSVALVIWALASRDSSKGLRRATMVGAMLVACGFITLLRTDGISGNGFELRWRWAPTAEERLLASVHDERVPAPPAARPDVAADSNATATRTVDNSQPNLLPQPRSTQPAEWPGFRGPLRDGTVRGVRIETEWSKSAPVKLWSRPIGPGWSSFAVNGDLLYTQEQRGNDEIVACYHVSTGQPVWRHGDPVRFYESNGGPGPRGTPTLNDGRVYSFGGTGVLNALDATNGAVIWSRNVATDSATAIPEWGFSSSPLVVKDLVIIAASGKLAAYDSATGKPRWFGPEGGFSYSSPQLITISGVPQILLLSSGVTSVAVDTGTQLWKNEWPGGAIVQPAVTPDGDILINAISAMGGAGIRRLAVTHKPDGGWAAEERWTSSGLKPYYNDFVVHKGNAYGFDGSILSSIDLTDGTRKWKGGRYGAGQMILLAEQDVLLVLSDEGDIALVSATPDEFKEIARVKGIEGKTWNHPVLVRDTLLVRNGEEMAAFRLSLRH